MTELPRHCDVIVVGAGPAGLAAATRLRTLGIRDVVVLERESEAGGIPRHCGHYPFGLREFHRLLKGPDLARRLVDEARRAGVRIFTGVSVMALEPGPQLLLSTTNGVQHISARRVILATGVRESTRATRLLGGSKPGGVLSTGALQGLVYLGGQRPFRRPVIVGTELVSFSALLTCRHAGIRPQAMIEEGDRPVAWRPSTLLPRMLGVETLFSTRVTAIHGRDQVTAVELLTPAGPRQIETDGVVVSGRFLPEASLIRASHLAFDSHTGGPRVDQFGRCSDTSYLATGNLLRPVETAGWSWQEGNRTGEIVAQTLAYEADPEAPRIRLECAHPALRYVMPQCLRHDIALDGAHPWLQLRVNRPVRGRLQLLAGSGLMWEKRISSRPERRLLIPTRALAKASPGDTVRIQLVEEPS